MKFISHVNYEYKDNSGDNNYIACLAKFNKTGNISNLVINDKMYRIGLK